MTERPGDLSPASAPWPPRRTGRSRAPASTYPRSRRRRAREGEQYSLAQILAIWAAVALPMALLAWAIGPAIIPHLPLHPGIVHWLLMIAGMIWQAVVALVVLRRELGGLRRDVLRECLWLNLPRDLRTGRARARLLWWVVPPLMFSFTMAVVLAPYLDAPVTGLFPALRMPARMDVSRLADPQFIGQWWLLGVALISVLFNSLLGEELLFRGVLLPKMRGVFGRWDWVANAVLCGLYHLHRPWGIPTNIVSNLAIAWPARRFRSYWMGVIVHGVQGLMVLALVLAVILGLGVYVGERQHGCHPHHRPGRARAGGAAVRALRTTRRTAPPGERCQSSKAGYATPALLVEAVSGESYEQHLQPQIYARL